MSDESELLKIRQSYLPFDVPEFNRDQKSSGVYDVEFQGKRVVKRFRNENLHARNYLSVLTREGANHFESSYNAAKEAYGDIFGDLISYNGETNDYVMPLVPGQTLYEIHFLKFSNRMGRDEAVAFIGAVDRCILTLHTVFRREKMPRLTGDWALHNLVWDEAVGKIVNVDLEGIVSCSPYMMRTENSIKVAIGWLLSVREKVIYDVGLSGATRLMQHSVEKSSAAYSGRAHRAGYHELLEYDGQVAVPGQRNNHLRIQTMLEGGVDFEGKNVFDIGSNQGSLSLLLYRCHGAKSVTGVDSNPSLVNIGNKCASMRRDVDVCFFAFDLDSEPLPLLKAMCVSPEGPDVVLLLSLCMWIEKWRETIEYCYHLTNESLVFESNGDDKQQKEQEEKLRQTFPSVTLISDASKDDPSQAKRKLFVCRK